MSTTLGENSENCGSRLCRSPELEQETCLSPIPRFKMSCKRISADTGSASSASSSTSSEGPKRIKISDDNNINSSTTARKSRTTSSVDGYKYEGNENDETNNKPCTFQKLGEDAHVHIVSYLLCLPAAPTKPVKNNSALWHFHHQHNTQKKSDRQKAATTNSNDGKPEQQHPPHFSTVTTNSFYFYNVLSETERNKYSQIARNDKARFDREQREYQRHQSQVFGHPRNLALLCRDLLSVSKHWRRIVGKVMNLKAPRDIISPVELSEIKSRVGRMDLFSTVRNTFLNLCEEMFGSNCRFLPSDLYHDDVEHEQPNNKCPLEYIVRYYAQGSYERFADMVAKEYRKFMVVKAIETIAATASSVKGGETERYWSSSSMPGQIIHIFWQAHMNSPQKYVQDCQSLLIGDGNDIIDCSCPSYRSVSPDMVRQYLSKRRTLFSFEYQLTPSEYFFTGRRPVLHSIEHVVEVASMLRDEEAMMELQHETDVDHSDNDD